MNTQWQWRQVRVWGQAIALLLVGLPALAQSPPATPRSGPTIVYVRREVSGPAPRGRYRGGGSRSGSSPICPATPVPLTALVPFQETYEKGRENLPPLVNVWGYTSRDRPTFWVYVPYANRQIPARFTLEEEATGTPLYQTAVTLPPQPGILGIPLPASAPALNPGSRYRWYFTVNCKAGGAAADASDNINVEAVVVRDTLPPAIARQLTGAPSLANAIALAQNGFWYDALTTLAQLRQQNPQDATLATAWKDLLAGIATTPTARQNFNLETIQTQPFVK